MSRFTKLIHPESRPGDQPEYYEVDVDAYLQRVEQMDFQKRLEEMNSSNFWYINLPHMKNTQKEKENFLDEFLDNKDAVQKREYALKGARASNSKASILAFQIYKAAKAIGYNRAPENHFVEGPEGEFELDFPQYKPLEKTSEGRLLDSELIGDMIADRVHWGASEVFKKLANFVEEPPCPQEDKSTFRLISFFDFVFDEFRLPTKSEIQKDWGVSDKQANRFRNELGLKGLPQKK